MPTLLYDVRADCFSIYVKICSHWQHNHYNVTNTVTFINFFYLPLYGITPPHENTKLNLLASITRLNHRDFVTTTIFCHWNQLTPRNTLYSKS